MYSSFRLNLKEAFSQYLFVSLIEIVYNEREECKDSLSLINRQMVIRMKMRYGAKAFTHETYKPNR